MQRWRRLILGILVFSGLSLNAIQTSEAVNHEQAQVQAQVQVKEELVIYTYDSFMARGGLGSEILPKFEQKYGCRVRALASGNGGQLLTRLEVDAKRGKSVAHLVVGIDQHVWQLIKPWTESWGDWTPPYSSQFVKEVETEKGFLPYDYGALAFMADRQMLKELKLSAPESLSDLSKSEWKRNFILEDPRTSTPGLAFVLFTQEVLGESVWNFWQNLKGQWLTMTPGWDGAYSLFLKREAPLVWSYLSSQAYHEEQGDTPSQRRYQAILFNEGQPFQIEGAAWVKGALKTEKQKALARNFLEFLVSSEVQEVIPKKVYMLPVRKDIPLPESFKHLPAPKKWVNFQKKPQEIKLALENWGRAVHR